MISAGFLDSTPDFRPLLGPKRMLLDQAHVDDSLETSAWKLHSRRRTTAAWLPHEQGVKLMEFYGWNATEWLQPAPGPHWRHDEDGVVWEALQYPESAPAESVCSDRSVLMLHGVRQLLR